MEHTGKDMHQADAEIYFDIIDHSATPLFAIDASHTVIMWNKACERLTGAKAADMIRTKNQWAPFYNEQRVVLADLVVDNAPGDVHAIYKNCSQALVGEGGLRAEGWFPNLGGSARYILFNASAIKNAQGEIIGAVETLEDITERRLCEEQNIKQLGQTVAELGGINELIAGKDQQIFEMKKEIDGLKNR